MSATDELRRMLEERGVEHTDADDGHTQHTWWSDGDHEIAVSNSGERLAVYNLTPEQAIAATLGAEDAYTREDVESAFVSGYSLGCLPVGSDPTWDQNEQTVDEYMAEWGWVRKEATLGEGTCRYELKEGRFVCSNCGRGTWAFEGKGDPLSPPNYCPNCGRRVV